MFPPDNISMRLLLIYYISITSVFAAPVLSGKIEVNVRESKQWNFRGFFWSDVDETIGGGDSPVVTQKDLLDAINKEFKSPKAALAQLEKLKGPGGKVLLDLHYIDASDKSPYVDGDMVVRCGVVSVSGELGKNEKAELYMETGSGVVSSAARFEKYPKIGDIGKFYQFKWASKEQISRFIAKCFARLSGMPDLKAKNPKGKTQLYIGDAMYEDFYKWLLSIDGINTLTSKNPKFRGAVKCLLDSAVKRQEDRTGNILILQSHKETERNEINKEKKGLVSELEFLGSKLGISPNMYHRHQLYSLAVMDASSSKKMLDDWEENTIQTEGIWPNYKSNNLLGLMNQVFGDQLQVNLKACLLNAGISIPNPNLVFKTIYDVRNCREVDESSLSLLDKLEIYCEMGRGDSCFFLGQGFIQGKQVVCSQLDTGKDQCNIMDGTKDIEIGRKYLIEGCEKGSAAACWAMGKALEGVRSLAFPNLGSKEHIKYYKRACELRPDIEECYSQANGVTPVSEKNLAVYERSCESIIDSADNCNAVSFYYEKIGDKEKQKKFLKKACRATSTNKSPEPCIKLKTVLLEEGKVDEVIELLEITCNFVDKIGCRDLIDIYDKQGMKKEKAKVIRRICWGEKDPTKVCF